MLTIRRRSHTLLARCMATTSGDPKKDPLWDSSRVNAWVGHSFPDFIEFWNRSAFRKVGYGLGTIAAALGVGSILVPGTSVVPALAMGLFTMGYWKVGWHDIQQTNHAIRRNFPVLGNVRYIFETIRPEIRQYFIESDDDGKPFSRLHRAQVYQRAKNVNDTLPFGTRRNVYQTHHEWALHSMWPRSGSSVAKRVRIGTPEFGTKELYDASVLNISAMSYGALSNNAILALNQGAKLGGFYHNTGEGGVSSFHKEGGADIVWNVGTGYFGCGTTDASGRRVFDSKIFQETIHECEGRIKMIEIKLSQGAKPGHGGLLPKSKITPEIAQARKLSFPATEDCHSPSAHSAFSNPSELIDFIVHLRDLSGGVPVGIKLCVGEPAEIASLAKAIVEKQNGPDFITVDGAEGGTGAAPPELSNSVGLPLEEGLVVVRNVLLGAGLRDKIRIIASGRVATAFSLVRTLALGADVANSARAFMMSLGCIQALKCNTNKCPTGITTNDPDLMYGLDPTDKRSRVFHFHRKTVEAAADIVGIMGYDDFSKVTGNDIMRRTQPNKVQTLSEYFPEVQSSCLLDGSGPKRLQDVWDYSETEEAVTRRWIY